MREILFRGKRKDNGEWVEGIPIKTHIGTFIVFEENPHYCGQYGYMEICELAMVDPATVGQYTGLKDMNGKWIFEGDVVRIVRAEWGFDGMTTDYRTELGAIAYDNWGMIGLVVDKYKGTPVWSDFFQVCALTDRVYDWSFEVIGNIHDNPELLEGGDSNG